MNTDESQPTLHNKKINVQLFSIDYKQIEPMQKQYGVCSLVVKNKASRLTGDAAPVWGPYSFSKHGLIGFESGCTNMYLVELSRR